MVNDVSRRPDIAIVLQHPCWGGVEQVYLNLARHWSHSGCSIDVLFGCAEGPLASDFEDCARVIDLKNVAMRLHRRERYALFDFAKVKRYIVTQRPRSVLSAKAVSNYCAARAKKELAYPGNVVISHHIQVQEGRSNFSPVQRVVDSWFKSYYQYADSAVGVSKGVTEGLLRLGLPQARLHTIYNPTVTEDMFRLAQEPPLHPWLNPKGGKVVLGVGRLTEQKGFDVLIRALPTVLASAPDVRLLIIGDGPERGKLERLVRDMALNGYVEMPGYVRNPYSFMRNADLYVLSSRYEGFGLTLVEAMALGTPVVSTDCPSGPSEILKGGEYGMLVPVGGPRALAEAMVNTLVRPRATTEAAQWVKDTFSVKTAADRYLALLLNVGSERMQQSQPHVNA